jgi:uncharacterized protein with beta-barrel porin domain
LQGAISDASGATVDFNQPATSGTYAGAITGGGNVSVEATTGTVTFTGNNAYTGTTTIGSGTLQIGNGGTTGAIGTGNITDNSTLTFDTSTATSITSNITGTGVLNQNGTGTLTLSGTNSYGATNINKGRLDVTGGTTTSGGAGFTVVGASSGSAGGTLGGTATVSGDIVNNGTVSPGTAGATTGTLTQSTGNYTSNSGSNFITSVNGAPGTNTQLSLTTGSATVNSGSKFQVNVTGSNFTAGQDYTAIATTNAATTLSSGATISTNSMFVTASLAQVGDDIDFVLTRNFIQAGQTFNQFQVATYINTNQNNTNTDFESVLNSLETLNSQGALNNALTQISGDIHPTMAQVAVNNTTLVVGQVAARLRAAPFAPGGPLSMADDGKPSRAGAAPIALVSEGPDGEPEMQCAPDQYCGNRWSGWSIGYGSGGSAQSDGNATGVHYGMGGVIAGLERWEDDCHLIGAYGAYVGSNVEASNDQNATMNGGQFGAYVFGDDGFNYYTLLGGFEVDGNTTNRTVSFISPVSPNSANTSDWQSFLYAERGVSFEEANYVVQPFVGLQYLYLRQNGFTESGGNTALDLTGDGDTTNSLRSMVGARLQYAQINHSGRRTLPEIHAMWMHEYLDTSSGVQATMVPIGGTPFIVQGLDMGRDWADLGGSFTWEMLDGWSMFVNYDLQINRQATYNIGSGGLGYSW